MPDGEKETGRTRWVRKGAHARETSEPLKCRLKEGNYAARRRAGGSLKRIVVIAALWPEQCEDLRADARSAAQDPANLRTAADSRRDGWQGAAPDQRGVASYDFTTVAPESTCTVSLTLLPPLSITRILCGPALTLQLISGAGTTIHRLLQGSRLAEAT